MCHGVINIHSLTGSLFLSFITSSLALHAVDLRQMREVLVLLILVIHTYKHSVMWVFDTTKFSSGYRVNYLK